MSSSTQTEMKPKLTPEIAEFIGMHIGDGTLYRTNSNSLVWEQRGDLKEQNYYDNHVYPLVKKLFGVDKKPKFRSGGKNGCYGIQTCNKKLISTLLEFNIKPGKKLNIKIPKEIVEANEKIINGFLRGYFDTDGCIRFERINKNKIPSYPRIEFATISKSLYEGLLKILEKQGLKAHSWEVNSEKYLKNYRIGISGKKKAIKWIKEISSHNPKHLKKFSKLLLFKD